MKSVIAAASVLLSVAGAATGAAAAEDREAGAAVAALKDVCLPLLRGAEVKSIAKSAGLRDSRDGWFLPIDGKRRIALSPPTRSNPHVCSLTVTHSAEGGADIAQAVSAWAESQNPPLQQIKKAENSTGALYQLTTSSWSGRTADGDLGIVYSADKTLDGKPVGGTLDQSRLLVSLNPVTTASN